MVEEFYGKISRSGSNLSDGLEDKLTGDFFGSLRYINFHDGLQEILCRALSKAESFQQDQDIPQIIEIIKNIKCNELQDDVNIEFWPKKTDGENRGELDVLLKFDNCYIGVEVKFRSGLSSDDQLIREAGMLCDWAEGRDKILLFVAPHQSCMSVYKNHYNEVKNKGVSLIFVSWEDILQSLKEIRTSEFPVGQSLIIQDLIKLLKHKEFEVFSSMVANVPYENLENDVRVMNKENPDYAMMYKNAAWVVFMTYKNVKELLKSIEDEIEKQTNKRGQGIGYMCVNPKQSGDWAKGIMNDFWRIFKKEDTVLYAVNIFLTDTNEENPSAPVFRVLKYSYEKDIPKISGEILANAYDDNEKNEKISECDSININSTTEYIHKICVNDTDKYYGLQSIHYVNLPFMDIRKEDVKMIVDIFDKLSTI